MLLTEQEVIRLWDSHTVPVIGKSGINPVVFATLIESAVLEKLKAQEPACFVGRIEDGAMLLMSMPDDWVATPLYEHPLPPGDVVRDPRVSELEAVLRECRDVIEEAQIYCEGPQWSPSMAHDCGTAIAKIDEVLHRDP